MDLLKLVLDVMADNHHWDSLMIYAIYQLARLDVIWGGWVAKYLTSKFHNSNLIFCVGTWEWPLPLSFYQNKLDISENVVLSGLLKPVHDFFFYLNLLVGCIFETYRQIRVFSEMLVSGIRGNLLGLRCPNTKC